MSDLERKKGVSGYSKVEGQIEDASKQKKVVDQAKDKTLQELTKTVEEIEA